MSIHDELRLYLRARVPLIVLVTLEELRALEVLDAVRLERDPSSDMVVWDSADQFESRAGRQVASAARPSDALAKIRDMSLKEPKRRDLYVLKDFHEFWSRDPQVRRQLRNLAQKLKYTGASLVVTTPTRSLPVELRDDAVVVDMPLPGVRDLRTDFEKLIGTTSGVNTHLTSAQRTKFAQAALGLTATQAQRAFAKAIVQDDVLDDEDIDAVLQEKKAVIRESEALEFYPVEETPDDVGGLEMLKKWLELRERAFSQEAAEFGLPSPKGMALIGIPGTGKSLTAKMIGGMWRLPLLRLDVSALFGSLVGESEERVRRALHLAETVSPCVLWIDEIEKALASGGLDGGTSQRVFGQILTWMQEKREPVFVVATANDVGAMPPETLRRGRFDEVFFLDLPTEEERQQIMAVHLRKRRRDPGQLDLFHLAQVAEGFTGAELEQSLIDAMYEAFADHRDVTTADISGAIERTVPLSKSHREAIENLRQWLHEGRAQSASFAEAVQAEQQQVPLERPPLELD